jgi:hypothetical protein
MTRESQCADAPSNRIAPRIDADADDQQET